MADPVFYFYPRGGVLQTITFPQGAAVSALADDDVAEGAQAETRTGRIVTATRYRRQTITVTIPPKVTRSLEPATVELLHVLTDHLKRGGSCAFAADSTQAWLSYLYTVPTVGTTSVLTTGSVGYSPTAVLNDGQGVKLETVDGGQLYRDDLTIATAVSSGGKALVFDRGIRYGLTAPGWIRTNDFFPALKLVHGTKPESNTLWLDWGWTFQFLVDRSFLQAGADFWRSLYLGSSAAAAQMASIPWGERTTTVGNSQDDAEVV